MPKPIAAAFDIQKPKPITAGWSSPVARQAHNLKVVSSNLAPATKITKNPPLKRRVFCVGYDAERRWAGLRERSG